MKIGTIILYIFLYKANFLGTIYNFQLKLFLKIKVAKPH